MKKFLFAIACVFSVASCARVVEPDQFIGSTPFTLTVHGDAPDTKLAFGADGLTTTWQPGDVLYIADVEGKKTPVKMTTSITSPQKSAVFVAESSVVSGEYVVFYGSDNILFQKNSHLTSIDNLNSDIVLYGRLTVADGQTSAEITMHHAFTRLHLTFKNVPTDISGKTFGMSSSIGFNPCKGKGTLFGLAPDTMSGANMGWYGNDAYVFISPIDLSGKKAYFYIYGTDANGRHVTYEVEKAGKELKEGYNYNLTVDFSGATRTSLYRGDNGLFALSTPAECRAAAYWNSWTTYNNNSSSVSFEITNDIDFANDTYLPIYGSLCGNYHTLKNIVLDMPNADYLGLVSKGTVTKILADNITIKGRDYVGGIVAEGIAEECGTIGNISGSGSFVGGVVGIATSTISGNGNPDKCFNKGDVIGHSFVGGVAGNGRATKNSYHIGNVTALNTSPNKCGGIEGESTSYAYPYCCYSYGEVTGGCGITSSGTYMYYCLSSLSALGGLSNSYYFTDCQSNCGPQKTFLSYIDALNHNEAYATQCWPGIDAKCPLLRWHATAFSVGGTESPDMNDDNW